MEGFFDDLIDSFRKNGRVEEMRQIAHANEFKFKDREKFAQQDYLLKSFSIFKGKKDKRLKGIMMKEELAFNADLRVYDYWYFGDLKKGKQLFLKSNVLSLIFQNLKSEQRAS